MSDPRDGELNLGNLLAAMQPDLQPEEYVFCTGPGAEFDRLLVNPIGLFHEAEGTTLILPRHQAEHQGLAWTYHCRQITLKVHSSLAAVGFLAAITQALAARGISVNPVSAYYHDHLFVPADQVDEAMACLAELSSTAQRKG